MNGVSVKRYNVSVLVGLWRVYSEDSSKLSKGQTNIMSVYTILPYILVDGLSFSSEGSAHRISHMRPWAALGID